VHGVLYVADLCRYELSYHCDESQLDPFGEMLRDFEYVCSSQWLSDMPIFVLLNKRELFEQKLQTVPLSYSRFFWGRDQAPESACRLMEETFREWTRAHDKVQIHFISALSAASVTDVFQNIKSTLTSRDRLSLGEI